MTGDQSREGDLSPNQEHFIAFLVIALFGLMYWFFMHDNSAIVDTKAATVATYPSSVDTASTDNVVIHSTSIDENPKKDEIQPRRDNEVDLVNNKAEEARLLSAKISSEESMRNSLAEQESKLAAEIKLKQETLEASIAADNLKSKQVNQQIAAAERAAEIDRINKESERARIEKQLAETEQKNQLEQEFKRLNFTLPSGKKIQITPDSFESRLKMNILNKVTSQALTFDNIAFSSGATSLTDESIRQIEGTASILHSYQDNRILLRGHTDNTGAESKNMTLSFNRSMNIKKELISLGIEPSRIGVEGVGSQYPATTNSTKEGRQENRRIDLLLLDE